jgi:hypothetical protein
MAEAEQLEKNPVGHPIVYEDQVFEGIIHRHSQGENLLKILGEPGMPEWATFWRRVVASSGDERLRALYRDARESWAERKVEETMEISEEDPLLAIQRQGEKDDTQIVRVDGAAVQHQKLRVDTRKWLVSKVLPKLYGDRVANVVQNPDGTPVAVPVLSLIVKKE